MTLDVHARAAITEYRAAWRRLREEALKLAAEAKTSPGPLTAAKLRNQAALVDRYAVIAHHAAWREEHPDPPEAEP